MVSRVHLSDQLREITPEIFTTASAILGIRGSGKTNDGVVLAENAIRAGVPVAIVDPTGVWYGLKSSSDGKAPGLPVYVFGGVHGDVPLEATAGPILARFVVEERVPVVLDVSDLTKGKQRRFVGEFCEALYDLKARRREPLLVIIDETPRFCPQQLQKDPDLAKCVGAVEDIVALGRSRGLGCAIIGQRAATINNNILTQADNLFAMRTVGTPDRKAIDAWVVEAQGDAQQRDEMMRGLATLPQGEGYFWSPAIFGVFRRVKFAARSTFDSSRTPKIGEKVVTPTSFASVDLDKLRGEIAATIERAKADDPKALRAEIATLQKQLDAKDVADPAEVKALRARIAELEARPVERVEVPVVTPALIDRLHAELAPFANIVEALKAATADLPRAVEPIATALARVAAVPIPVRPVAAATSRAAAPTIVPVRPSAAPRATDGSLGGGPMKMLEALAGTREGRATRTQLGMLAGFSAGGGTFAKYLSTLRSANLVAGDGSTLLITPEGRDRVGSTARAVSTAEVHAMWRAKLGGGPRKMLDALLGRWPAGMTKAELGDETGFEPSGGTFAKYLSTISGLDLVERRGGTLVATDALFPTGALR